VTKPFRVARPRLSLLMCTVLLSALGCTDLQETPTSSITPENFYRNEAEVLGGLASVYAQLRGTLDDYWYASEVSSDEIVVPTRGSDWYDNGQWLELKRQTWTASSPSGLAFMNGSWNTPFTGIARANVLLDALQRVTVPNQGAIVAELRTLRGFYYYILMDMFGGVPIVTDIEIKPRARNTRTEVFQFIESELLAARTDLPDSWPSTSNGRLTKGAADAILASMYLNAGVWMKETGVSPTAYNTCLGVVVSGGADACQAAIDAADRIINSGQYSLAAVWRSNFTADNGTSPENIMVVKFLNKPDLGMNFIMRALHYNQLTGAGPWNGFATTAQIYTAFDANDQRRQMWLEGPQTNVETGVPVCERPSGSTCAPGGTPLVFTDSIRDITQATEGEGPRFYKWPADPNRPAGEINGNDFAYFRLAEIYLIKAEALNEQTPGSATALGLVNTLRARVFTPAVPLAAIDRASLLRERLFELATENKRRQDLIRHGVYTAAWDYKLAGAANLILMPIPQPQLDANPLLVQNPGY